jgi:hypothetical protein
MIFGAAYASGAVIPDGTALPEVANPVADYVPCARPGSRAPHVWLQRAGKRVSTHDLVALRYTLLTGPRGQAWSEAANVAAQALRIPLARCTIGEGGDVADPDRRWTAAYGVETDGAVLLRPDGYVAWRQRCSAADPRREIESALRVMLRAGRS